MDITISYVSRCCWIAGVRWSLKTFRRKTTAGRTYIKIWDVFVLLLLRDFLQTIWSSVYICCQGGGSKNITLLIVLFVASFWINGWIPVMQVEDLITKIRSHSVNPDISAPLRSIKGPLILKQRQFCLKRWLNWLGKSRHVIQTLQHY